MISREQTNMQSTTYTDLARSWGRTLEDREATRSGVSVRDARKAVARRAGVSPGTLETLRIGRLKTVATHIYERLRAAVIADLQHEIRRLEHELEIARQSGMDPRCPEVAEVEKYLALARQALAGEGVGNE